MEIQETEVPGAFRVTPRLFTDARGGFFESFRHDELARATGHVFTPAQTNYSSSVRGTLRGMHGVTLPPGQSKFVSCVRGAVMDVVVDVRLGSPTFGTHTVTELNATEGRAMYVAEGLAHGFVALTDDACVSYLCSTLYVPGTQVDIWPFDPELALPWADILTGEPVMSAKDSNALTLSQNADQGRLATYTECLAHYAAKRRA
ncbi:dTDP-4-dehydrorhamnose 3,5-epimerase family protein [Amycolatopsis sp. NPDC059657]|uniref:dTDP-4-dehydrorhamnose 3,5-epimerase family protein n=1 Tax=Amycolatopsis sp. NPDC059657 TaxID=3346899 RepID=UPI00366BE9D8